MTEELVDRISDAARERPLLWLSGEGSWLVPGLPDAGDLGRRVAIPLWLTDFRAADSRHHLLAAVGVQGGWVEWRSA